MQWHDRLARYVTSLERALEAGRPIDQETLNTVVHALQDEPEAWTGGRFGLAGLEIGTESREGVSGWITVKWPADPDAGICARAHAYLRGRAYVTPDDVKAVAPDVLRHRVITTYEAEAEEVTADDIVARVLATIHVP